ncbi:MAG: hypothetical protein KF754_04465 [Planctomycetes bacterium]|nr:hypothetical protein [Planctomycetota bacterium]
MNTQQRNVLVRNLVGGIGLVVLALFLMTFFGVFDGEQSNEAQVRKLMESIQDEINDHDWHDLVALSDATPEEADIWLRSVPKQAQYVVIDTITPKTFLNVPDTAREFVVEVTVLARYEAAGMVSSRPIQADGKLYFVKLNIEGKEAWRLDLKRSAPSFPYLPNPKLPPRAPPAS